MRVKKQTQVKPGTLLGARLLAAIEDQFGGDVDEVHYRSRVSPQVIYAIINGTTFDPRISTVGRLVNVLGDGWVWGEMGLIVHPSDADMPEYLASAA